MFDGLIGVKDSGESLDLFFDGQDEPFTIAKHGNDALVAQLMPYVVPDSAQKLNEGGNDAYDPKRAARQAAIETKKAEIAAQQAALDEQQAGLDAMAQEEEYADVPTESESEAMAAGAQEQALAEASAAREQASAAARAEGSAEAEAAWAARQAADARLPPAAPAPSTVSLGSGPAPLVESDEAREARRIREANAANPTWRNSPAVGAPTYAVTTFGEPVASDAGIESDVRGPSALQQIRSGLAAFGERFLNQSDAAEALAVQEAARPPRPADESTALSPEEQAMARRSAGGREAGKFEAFKTQAAGAPPQGGGSQGRRAGGSVSTSTRTPGESNLAFKANELPPDPEAEARALERAILADTMGEIALAEGEEMGRLATERALAEERYKKEYDEMVFKRDAEARQMRQEIMNGKVNPDRVYAEMGTAQKIGTMIGMIMGGLGTVGTGRDNPVIAAIRREVDRDIEIQKDSLDRKDSIYKQFLAEGRDSIEAWKLSRAMALDSIATKAQAVAARYGGEKEMLRAQEVGMKFEQDAAKERAEAEQSYYARQLNEFKIVNDANAANATAKYQAERVKVDWYDARTRRMSAEQAGRGDGTGKTLAVEIMPGQWIQAADPTAREKIAAGRDGHASFIKGIEMLEKMRRDNPGGSFLPGWMSFMGFSSAEKSKVGDSLAGAVQLAFLKAQGAGAYDKGSGALAQGIIESPAKFFGTNDDAFFKNAAELKALANDEYMATIRGRMAPGQAPELFGSAPMNSRVVGRVP